MKKTILLSAVIILAISKCIAQGTYVVNNIPGSAANYHVLQHALDSVPSGSIILLQNSGLNYGQAIIKKPLVIYGAGYFLGQNAAPNTQANLSESLIKYLEFDSGSQGSIVSGLHIKDSANDQSLINTRVNFGGTNNVTLSRCIIDPAVAFSYNYSGSAMQFGNCSNITVEQCYINVLTSSEYFVWLNSSSNILLTNNLIVGYIDFSANAGNSSTYILKNNTFYGNIAGTFHAEGCQMLENNVIIVTDTSASITSNNGLYNNPFSTAGHNITNVQNLFKYDGLADNTNLVNPKLTIDSLFLDFSNPLVSSNDGIFQLRATAVAKKFGNDGTDAGAFGGTYPYVLSGIPAIPNIYFAQVPQTGTSNGGLKVHLKIQANN